MQRMWMRLPTGSVLNTVLSGFKLLPEVTVHSTHYCRDIECNAHITLYMLVRSSAAGALKYINLLKETSLRYISVILVDTENKICFTDLQDLQFESNHIRHSLVWYHTE